MNRVSFLVDGFNLYHSIRDAQKLAPSEPARWLDLNSFLTSYLPVFGRKAALNEIYYFSAIASHRDRHNGGETTRKHTNYINCLKHGGVKVEMGRFKPKDVWCSNCKKQIPKHEEKETDVAISVKMMELCHLDACDTLVLVSGDTDLAPPIRTVKRLFPQKQLAVILPYKRHNNELKQITDKHISVKAERYRQHQLPDPFDILGNSIAKPDNW